MQNFDASGLAHSLVALTALDVPFRDVLAQQGVGLALPMHLYVELLITAEKLEHQLGDLECFVSQITAGEVLRVIRDEAVNASGNMPPSKSWSPESVGKLQHASSNLRGRIIDELKSKSFLSLSPAERVLLDSPLSFFGDDISDSFPEAIYDLDEGMQCLALSRYTACVFHLMRAAERAVSTVASRLGATVVKRDGESLSWGVLVANLGSKIEGLESGVRR